MKKIIAILMLAVLFSWTSVDAASVCSYEKQKELSKVASNVKLTYEEAQGIVDPENYHVPEGEDPETFVVYYDYFKIKILNITESIYVKLENSFNDEVKYIKYEDTDEGIFVIDWNNLKDVTTFNYTIYSSSKTECPDEEIRKGVLTTPMLNENYTNVICLEIPDFSLCQKYITTSISEEQFRKKAEAYLEKEEKKEEKEEIKEERKKNNTTILIISASILIVGGGIAFVIARKKRGSRII